MYSRRAASVFSILGSSLSAFVSIPLAVPAVNARLAIDAAMIAMGSAFDFFVEVS